MPVNRRSIHGPPNSPGGRLMPCTTISVGSAPAGRASQCGDSTWRTAVSSPVAVSMLQRRCCGGSVHRVRLVRRMIMPQSPAMTSANAPYVARDLAHVWHPCTQMKDHEQLPLDPDPPRQRCVARGLRRPALPRRHQLLVGEPLRPRQPAHQRRGARAAGAARARDPRRLHPRAGDRALRGAGRRSPRRPHAAASTPTTAPPRSKSR